MKTLEDAIKVIKQMRERHHALMHFLIHMKIFTAQDIRDWEDSPGSGELDIEGDCGYHVDGTPFPLDSEIRRKKLNDDIFEKSQKQKR